MTYLSAYSDDAIDMSRDGDQPRLRFESVREACGKVPMGVFKRAAKDTSVSDDSHRMALDVLVKGCLQARVARRFEVPRQRVHFVCQLILAKINKL